MKLEILLPAYFLKFKLKGNGRNQYSIFQLHCQSDYKQAARQIMPEMTYDEHYALARLNMYHYVAANITTRRYVAEKFLSEFGREMHVSDYKVSGIVTDAFSEETKNKIRMLLDIERQYEAAHELHKAQLRKADQHQVCNS